MYNRRMPITTFEIRRCDSCGLRYPLSISGRSSNLRCPACNGDTRLIISRELVLESWHKKPQVHSRLSKYYVLLDNIRSAWNVGSILRSADGFGYAHAYLCGITPTPENDAVRKTSLGAEKTVTWSYHKDSIKLAEVLNSKGWRIIALEGNEQSIPLIEVTNYEPSRPVALIVGNEITGVDPHLLDLCDEIYHIPMHGEKKSFNVAIAFGIAAYALR
ncbi:MAG TPA: rRNA methyltransferase [Anaerolineae bacterium]|nr:rRNA methyltransferase [Anaerolineae bacterium]